MRILVDRIRQEQGRLDILVNDIWCGDNLTERGMPFWELTLSKGWKLLHQAVFSHMVTNRYAAHLMIEKKKGLVIEVTDGDSPNYRGNLQYDLVKSSVIRLAYGMAEELIPQVLLPWR